MSVYDRSAVMSSWTKRSLLCCTFIAIVIFIRIYQSRRRKREKKLKRRGQNEPISLWILTQLTFIWCICSNLIYIGETVPVICNFVIFLRPLAISYPHTFLSFYQLARLKASFNASNDAHDITAGLAYPNCVYTALYVFGTIQAIFFLVIRLIVMISSAITVEIYELPHNSGCEYRRNADRNSVTAVTILRVVVAFIFLIWEWIIIGMYVCRLYQLQARFKLKQATKSSVSIRELLKKILFLTAITETILIVYFVWSSIAWLSQSHFQMEWINAIVHPLDCFVVFMVLYLMLEENHKDYKKLLQWMRKCGCLRLCCCCFGDFETEYATIQQNVDAEDTKKDNSSDREMDRTENHTERSIVLGERVSVEETRDAPQIEI